MFGQKNVRKRLTLLNEILQTPILSYPNFNESFILDTDASNFAIGAVLSQNIDGQEKVVAYASRALTKSERKYCITRKELLAVVYFVKYFRHYLYGRRFTVRTDHGSIRWLLNLKNPEGQLARWIEVLTTYDMDIQHRPGTQHRNADAFSRHSCGQCKDKEMKDTIHAVNNEELINCSRSGELLEERSLIELQQSDKDISMVRKLKDNNRQPDTALLSFASSTVKALWSQRQKLVIENGMMYRRWIDEKGVTL